MENDIIESPWLGDGYICHFCKKESFYLFRYCPRCGKENDWMKALDSHEGHPFISNTEELKVIFKELCGLKIRLWDYSISHAIVQLRIAHCDANTEGNRFNTVIIGVGTERISSSTHSWNLNLNIDSFKGKYKTIFRLTDNEAGFLLEASNIGLYQKMPARFFGK